MKVRFQCKRCLLVVEHDEFDVLYGRGEQTRPKGWDVVQERPGSFRFDWHCPTCIQEIAAGSPRVL